MATTSTGFAGATVPLIASTMTRQLCLGLVIMGTGLGPALAAGRLAGQVITGAQFDREIASVEARYVADWALSSANHSGLPFIILDKKAAKVFVFNSDGKLRGAAPALIGFAVGDDSVPGIGEKKLSAIRPEERTTPAGRFVASLDRNLKGGQILWVDYDAAVSLHPVITSNAKERRAQRLITPSPLDNRISYGCINVPADFFRNVISPAFASSNGIVYVLPETRSVKSLFNSQSLVSGNQ